jgi:ubiquinol-cytochrome c reductase cytochrome c subunit
MPAYTYDVQQVPRVKPVFSQKEIDAMAAYVASLGPGPEVPTADEYSTDDATAQDVAEGGEIFRTNCAMCHNVVGSGGALTNGKYAPNLMGVEPKHIYEAMVTGPQSMPVFSDSSISPEGKQDIIAWVRTIKTQPQPGGLNLGGIGPVSEGLAAWVVGLAALIGCAVWLGSKAS